MRLAFLGTPDFAVTCLAALIEAGHEIAAVYSQPPAPRGRGHELKPSAAHAFAQAHGVPVRTPVSMRDPAEIAAFAALGLDAAVVVAFGQILPREVLEAPRLGAFNLHASLLPRWRGAAPIQRAIMAGDKFTGVEVMRMTEGLDEGPVLAVETPQAEEGITYARKIRPKAARLDWTRPAAELDHKIRGLSPFPGAWFEVPGDKGPVRVKALLSRVEDVGGAPGLALDDALLVGCGEGAVRLLRVQREGKGPQAADVFLRGFPVAAGTRLG